MPHTRNDGPATGDSVVSRSADPDDLDAVELVARLLACELPEGRRAASDLLESFELARLSRASSRQIAAAGGVSSAAADRLVLAFALGRRVELDTAPLREQLSTPARIHRCLAHEVRGLTKETFFCLALDSQHRLLRKLRVSEGTLTSALVHPREVFAPALSESAAAIVVAHNHPSGDPEPSKEDLTVTRRLIDAGRLLGIPLLDHVILAGSGYVSLRSRMTFEAR